MRLHISRGIVAWTAASFLIAACLGVALPCAAQEPEQAKDDAKLVAEIYGKTKVAKTTAEFTEIIDQIGAAQQRQLSQAHVDYLKSLLAWSYNRRGETRIEQLARASDAGQSAQLAAEALADFEESFKLDGTRWKTLLNRGVSYAQAGKLKEAEADMSAVVRLNPDYANAWFNRGEIYFAQGKYDQAIADYQRVLQRAPRDFAAVTAIGHAYFVQKQYESAVSWYNRAVQLQPNSAEALANRGDAYHRRGQWDRAGSDYLAAIALDGSLGRAYQGGAWLRATCPVAAFRDPAQAVAAAERAIELDGDGNYQYLDTLAAAYARAGDFAKAQQTIAKAIEKAPEADREVLRMRQSLYAAGKPYDQFSFRKE
jgi:tetratricopeptide (TPR) repeat protein